MKKGLRTLFSAVLCTVTLLTGCGRRTGDSHPGVIPEQTGQTVSVEIIDVTKTDAPETTESASGTTQTETASQTAVPETTEELTTAPPPPETTVTETTVTEAGTTISEPEKLDPNGSYNSKEDVALYIYTYGKLPSNYITKKEAQKLGWSGGSLEPYAPGKSIGGTYFGNYEELLPVKKGRSYTECDIDTVGKSSRGAKRIVFSNDGLIYYTEDHYNTFELLYGEE